MLRAKVCIIMEFGLFVRALGCCFKLLFGSRKFLGIQVLCFLNLLHLLRAAVKELSPNFPHKDTLLFTM